MKRILPISILSLLLLLGSCDYMKKKGWIKDKKQEQLAQARADSLRTDSLRLVSLEKERIKAEAKQMAESDKAKAIAGKNKSGYDVIIGSFKVANYATAFAKDVEGMSFKVTILQSENGFNLVSIGHFETYGAAAAEIRKINEGNQTPMELWVY
ncbi:SPOR domain-containing protein [Williamwhitmania taraxaci]|uniref:Sporulation related domain-containing protein n=1 Tax=Williamwhitmania taraxaci TaxID=1640674 RepID=A0A1G6SF48_9BACT|nr:SPOR domain-containing protein [Williamwhitmania taraxaci]SDD15281.1 Sporulation related domain-containing protein [Williamwhitmania taraxaci]